MTSKSYRCTLQNLFSSSIQLSPSMQGPAIIEPRLCFESTGQWLLMSHVKTAIIERPESRRMQVVPGGAAKNSCLLDNNSPNDGDVIVCAARCPE